MSSSQAHTYTVDDLPPQVLELVLAHACAPDFSGDGRGSCRPNPAIPLVCRRWREAYEQSTLLWEDVWFYWLAAARHGDSELGALRYAARWLAKCLPFCRRLTLAGFPGYPLPLADVSLGCCWVACLGWAEFLCEALRCSCPLPGQPAAPPSTVPAAAARRPQQRAPA